MRVGVYFSVPVPVISCPGNNVAFLEGRRRNLSPAFPFQGFNQVPDVESHLFKSPRGLQRRGNNLGAGFPSEIHRGAAEIQASNQLLRLSRDSLAETGGWRFVRARRDLGLSTLAGNRIAIKPGYRSGRCLFRCPRAGC